MASEVLSSEEQHQLKRAGWLLMFVGLLSIAVGVIVLLKPSDSLVTLSVIAGIFILVDGAFDLFASFSRRTENRGLAAVVGVVSIVVGVLLIRHPISGVLAVALLIGIWLIAAGVVRVVRAFDGEHRARLEPADLLRDARAARRHRVHRLWRGTVRARLVAARRAPSGEHGPRSGSARLNATPWIITG
jgi:short repeat uncharacterized protein DUF308